MNNKNQIKDKMNLKEFLKDFLVYLKPHKKTIFIMYLFALANVASMIAIPILIRLGIDRGIVPKDKTTLIIISLVGPLLVSPTGHCSSFFDFFFLNTLCFPLILSLIFCQFHVVLMIQYNYSFFTNLE